MKVLSRIAEMRAARAEFAKLGLVPTMGFLHEGHLSLVARARAECGAVAVSIFVNPTQFSPAEDLARYPRDVPHDLALLREAGADLVFLPELADMYPPGFTACIEPGGPADRLEGAARPRHFSGVATVVTKLLGIVQPTRAYFGQKDGQQCAVIRHIVRDLDINVDIVVGDTVREADGLALSSRNVYLTVAQRAAAPVLFRALQAAKRRFDAGERCAEALRATLREVIAEEPIAELDYASVADPDSLAELDTVAGHALALVAARFGTTRLIDNLVL